MYGVRFACARERGILSLTRTSKAVRVEGPGAWGEPRKQKPKITRLLETGLPTCSFKAIEAVPYHAGENATLRAFDR